MSTFASATGEAAAGTVRGHTHDMADLVGGSLAADNVPNIPASKVTSGTIPAARVPALSRDFVSDQIPAARFTGLDASRFPSDAPWARVQAAFAGVGWNAVGSYAFGGWDGSRTGMMWQYVAGEGVRGSCIAVSGWINMRGPTQGMTGTWVNCGDWTEANVRVITLFHKIA